MKLKYETSVLAALFVFLLCSCRQEYPPRIAADAFAQQHSFESEPKARDSEATAEEKRIARKQDQLLENVLDGSVKEKRGDLAKEVSLRRSYVQCVKESNAIHPAMMGCNESEYEYQDARLNKAYRNLMDKLAVGERAALKQEERDWINQRDALCQSNGALGGGQAEELEDSSCMLNATAKRADDLEKR
ncbi:lysozyme inhibitor LprI family protein [Xanthomonas sp. NCPPB 1638]|uniref:lysozyme inhibitor LprI family protein n=1 Tax=Xanthomonas TaxID=338 RepID=UPI0023674CDC|nr:lysozyme inhibitor LprI family protein [Xanthomonas cucurbitae]WDM77080.1 lysozyme inhibitor LprI family protein [Xanthomonas cucurbitae]